MPGKDTIHNAKWDRCVKKVEDMGKSKSSAAAICSSSIEDAGVKTSHQKKDKKDYYANRKKADKKNEGVLKFDDFSVNENLHTYMADDSTIDGRVLSRILYLSDTELINDAQEMQDNLENIHDLITKYFPELEPNDDNDNLDNEDEDKIDDNPLWSA